MSAHHFCFFLSLLLYLHGFYLTGTRGQKSDGALMLLNSEEGEEEDVTVKDEDEDFEVVQPNDKWQTLRPGQAVPAGSHVRLNLQTGEKEVRLGEEQMKYWSQEHRKDEDSKSSLNPDVLKKAMKKIKEDLNLASRASDHQDSAASRYRPLEEIKKDMAELDLLVETDLQIMRRLLDQLSSSSASPEQRLKILEELEYLVHQVDNAQALCSMGGLGFLLQALNSSDARLQENAALVLGSAVASNPAVQVKAVEGGALQTLLTALATVQPFTVRKKVLFAVAALLRHFPYAQQHFLSHGGLQVLSQLFKEDRGGRLRPRIVTILHDMISEKELMSQADLGSVQDLSQEQRLHQYSQLSLQGDMLDNGWCRLVPELLQSEDHDHREKALQALLVMAPLCLDQYRSDGSLLGSLQTLKLQYAEVIQSKVALGEDNSYFTEILELIDSLQVQMKPADVF